MAAAISSMEEGSRLPLSRGTVSRPSALMVATAAAGNPRRSLRIQSRSPSSSTAPSRRAIAIGGGGNRRGTTTRGTTTTSPSTAAIASDGSGVGPSGPGGVWASILSMGAAALPFSLLPFSSSASNSAPPSPRLRRQAGRSSVIMAAARARAGSVGMAPRRLPRSQRSMTTATAAAASAVATGSASRPFSFLSLPSSAVAASTEGGVHVAQVLAQADASSSRAAGVAGQALAPAPVPAAGADVDAEPAAPIAVETGDVGAAVRIDDEFSGNVAGRLMAEEGSGGVRSRDAGVSASTAMAVALAVSPTAAVAGGSGKGTRRKKVYLAGGGKVYTCSCCRAHLATRDHVVSECFHGHGGRAFLFERCVNVTAGKPEDRMLMTGMHVVADIKCTSCGAELGWKYESAAEAGQKYKEGKFILERCAVSLEGCDGDGYIDYFNSRHSSLKDDRYGYGYRSEYGSDGGCGSTSGSGLGGGFVAWGADHAPIPSGGGGSDRW